MVCVLCVFTCDDCCGEICNDGQTIIKKNEIESPMQTVEI